MTPAEQRAAADLIERAKQEVFAICKGRYHGGHEWRMSIPVNDERDSDRIIMAGLEAGAAALTREREARRLGMEKAAQIAETRAIVYTGGSRLEVGKEIARHIRALTPPWAGKEAC